MIPQTKHGLITAALTSEIETGRYKTGDLLPSEPELSQRFGVSRHTVRAALRSLQELGLVFSQKGVGSRVQEAQLASRYSHGFSSAEDLLQYAASTRVRVVGEKEEVAIDAATAALFGCKPREHWWRLCTVRKESTGNSVVAYSEIHVPLAFGSVLNEPLTRQPIFAQIAARFGQTITEIQQEITCIAATTDQEAAFLQVPLRSPAMQIIRRYLGNDGKVIEVARSLHPCERFKYAMRVQLQQGERPR
ncbi:MAG: GntR family transcriptional regulator [Pseudomonadota bacterium]